MPQDIIEDLLGYQFDTNQWFMKYAPTKNIPPAEWKIFNFSDILEAERKERCKRIPKSKL
jgi:hypothetical protein